MTNAELIQKIRAEIERQRKFIEGMFIEGDNNFYDGQDDAYNNILTFLSILESEKPINPEEAMKELDEKIALVKKRGTWDGVDVDKYMDEVRGREPEKPINLEELEKEITRTYHDGSVADTTEMDHVDYENIARHFAQWGAEHLADERKTSPNDLVKAAEAEEDSVIEGVEKDDRGCPYISSTHVYNAFVRGAKWQAEQDKETIELAEDHAYLAGAVNEREKILSEAVEGFVATHLTSEGTKVTVNSGYLPKEMGINSSDKVRIIIVKED